MDINTLSQPLANDSVDMASMSQEPALKGLKKLQASAVQNMINSGYTTSAYTSPYVQTIANNNGIDLTPALERLAVRDLGRFEDKFGSDVPNDSMFNVDVAGWLDQIKYFLDKQYEFNQASAERSMEFEREEAEKLREWQEMMSNTQFQRAMADMKKAGINPLLAFNAISGADVPQGAMASGSHASGSYGSPTSILSSFVSMMASNKDLLGDFLRAIGSILKFSFSNFTGNITSQIIK